MSYQSSQGILFKFNDVAYTATSLSVSQNQGEFNVTSLDIPEDSAITRYRAGPLKSVEIKVDWVGSTLPPTDKQYDLAIEGDGPGRGTALSGGESLGKAIATGVTMTAAAGELLKGSATFKLSVD